MGCMRSGVRVSLARPIIKCYNENMPRFLGIILAASFILIAVFGLGNVASDWHDNGHNCSLVTISGPACQINDNLLSLISLYLPSATVVGVDILLVAIVLFYYATLTPGFYRQRLRQWLSLLECRADRYNLLTA